MNPELINDIFDILANGRSYFQVGDAPRFAAVTETDLLAALREKGWRLTAAGFFLSQVQQAGFQVKQGYQFPAKAKRSFSDGSTGRALSQYQTIIFV